MDLYQYRSMTQFLTKNQQTNLLIIAKYPSSLGCCVNLSLEYFIKIAKFEKYTKHTNYENDDLIM